MQSGTRLSLFVGGIVVLFWLVGCKNGTEQPNGPTNPQKSAAGTVASPTNPGETEGNPGETEGNSGKTSGPAEDEPVTVTEEPTPPLTIPVVSLDAANATTCLVKVGDTFPEGTLTDAAGKPIQVQSLLGKNLAVIYFWTNKDPYSVAGLEDLGTLIPKELTDMEAVRVIAVNEGDSPEAVRPLLEKTPSKTLHLFDSDGAYFKKIATKNLPRVYLLDSDGKIVWFDIEYSRSMKRNLQQALEVALSTKLAPK